MTDIRLSASWSVVVIGGSRSWWSWLGLGGMQIEKQSSVGTSRRAMLADNLAALSASLPRNRD